MILPHTALSGNRDFSFCLAEGQSCGYAMLHDEPRTFEHVDSSTQAQPDSKSMPASCTSAQKPVS